MGTGSVTDNGSLIFNRSSAITVANAISGNGSLTQAGSGTLVLTGSNSYGNTTISAGTLQVGSGSTAGTLGTGTVTDNATLVFNRSNAFTVTNAITGTGNLTQAGSGALILTGSNNFLNTTISKGTLQVGNGTGAGTLGRGAVTDNAALVFNLSNNPTVDNAISGSGSLTQAGSGMLVLTGSNSYGNTTISAGTLQVGNGGTAGTLGNGTVTDNAALVFNRNGDIFTVANKISGNGTVTQAGSDTLTLAGALSGNISLITQAGTLILSTSNSNTGTTTINAGTLQVGNGTAGTMGNGTVTDNGSLIFNRSSAHHRCQ